jgi:hypothetical protein
MYSKMDEIVFQRRIYFLLPQAAMPPPRAVTFSHCLGCHSGRCRLGYCRPPPPPPAAFERCLLHPSQHRPSSVLFRGRETLKQIHLIVLVMVWPDAAVHRSSSSPSSPSTAMSKLPKPHRSSPNLPPSGQGELRRPPAKCRHQSPTSTLPPARRPTPPPKRFGRSPFLGHKGNKIKNG